MLLSLFSPRDVLHSPSQFRKCSQKILAAKKPAGKMKKHNKRPQKQRQPRRKSLTWAEKPSASTTACGGQVLSPARACAYRWAFSYALVAYAQYLRRSHRFQACAYRWAMRLGRFPSSRMTTTLVTWPQPSPKQYARCAIRLRDLSTGHVLGRA